MDGMVGMYRVRVKNGDYDYGLSGVVDYVADFPTLAEGLKEFLEWAEDGDENVSLRFKPKKKNEKEKEK